MIKSPSPLLHSEFTKEGWTIHNGVLVESKSKLAETCKFVPQLCSLGCRTQTTNFRCRVICAPGHPFNVHVSVITNQLLYLQPDIGLLSHCPRVLSDPPDGCLCACRDNTYSPFVLESFIDTCIRISIMRILKEISFN